MDRLLVKENTHERNVWRGGCVTYSLPIVGETPIHQPVTRAETTESYDRSGSERDCDSALLPSVCMAEPLAEQVCKVGESWTRRGEARVKRPRPSLAFQHGGSVETREAHASLLAGADGTSHETRELSISMSLLSVGYMADQSESLKDALSMTFVQQGSSTKQLPSPNTQETMLDKHFICAIDSCGCVTQNGPSLCCGASANSHLPPQGSLSAPPLDMAHTYQSPQVARRTSCTTLVKDFRSLRDR